MRLVVGTPDLRQALMSVLPHAFEQRADEDTDLARLRLIEDPVNVTVVATDTHTVAAAVVSVWEGSESAGSTFDLSPDVARKVLAVHKPVKTRAGGDEFEPEQSLMLEVDDDGQTLTTRDVSGLFPGEESLSVPLLGAPERFPDLAGYLGETVQGHDLTGSGYDGQPVSIPHEWLTRFTAAAKAYKAPLALRLVGGDRYRLLVTVGDSFIGLANLSHPQDKHTEDQETTIDAWHQWRSRLPDRMRRTSDDDESAAPDAWEPGIGRDTARAGEEEPTGADGDQDNTTKKKRRRLQAVND